MTANLTFFSNARAGLAQLVATPATGSQRGTLALEAAVQGGGTTTLTLSPYGPGDVVGLDERQVVRVEPGPETPDFPPNRFPFVEFDRPDLPWLFSPAAPAGDRLDPWIALVVLEEGPDVVYDPTAQPLPRLSVAAAAAAQLPAAAELWAWAHVQVSGDLATGETLDNLASPRTLSRVLSPRRLRPGRRYRACLVPAFAAGREAGLGEPVTSGLAAAWGSGAVDLPVYVSWRFGTGREGDFESLARRLRPLATTWAAARPLDCTSPGGGLPAAGRDLGLEGALRPLKPGARATPAPAFTRALTALLDAGAPGPGGGSLPVLTPPVYGRWPAAVTSLRRAPAWIRELNLDPRQRAAAEIGAQVVRDRQEELMAAAWMQVGAIQAANAVLRAAQLARGATVSAVQRRLAPLDAETLVAVAAPVLGRIASQASAAGTLLRDVRASRLPDAALGPAFRRAVRPTGPLARRGERPLESGRLVGLLNGERPLLVPVRTLPDGAQTHPMLDQLGAALVGPPLDPAFRVVDERGEPVGDPSLFQAAALELQGFLDGVAQLTDPSPDALDLDVMRATILAGLDGETTVPARVLARIDDKDGTWNPADPLEPIMKAPSFPLPMFGPLRERSQQLVAPGIDQLPAESATLLAVNHRFVNSYMVGANHELGRELLWRGFPTDQGGTPLRQFWDPRTRVPPAGETTPPDLRDLPALDAWPAGTGLETGVGSGGLGRVVLVLRGELLRRYPDATVYALEATGSPPAPGTKELHPAFQGTLDPDAAFYGFDLSEATVIGPPGWFFVLQEQPTEPGFGLEVERPGVFASSATKVADLSWGELAVDETALDALENASLARPNEWPVVPAGDPDWGATACDIAILTLQLPARVLIHASHLVAP